MSALSSASRMRARLPAGGLRPSRRSRRASPARCPPSSAGSQRSASSRNGVGAVPVEASCARRADALGAAGAPCPPGSCTVKSVPRPSRLATATSPPCSLTSSCTSARPMPVPSWVRERALRHPVEALEQRGRSASANADAGVADRSSTRSPRSAQRHADLALEGELEGVGEQVEDDLLPHVAVDVDRLRRGPQSTTSQARLLEGGAEHAGQLGGERREVGRLVARLDAAGLDAREVEQRVDELEQPQAVAVRDVKRLATSAGRPCASRARPPAGRASASAACGTRG